MHYMFCIKPEGGSFDDLKEEVERDGALSFPSNGMHISLLNCNVLEKDEQILIKAVSGMKTSQFETCIIKHRPCVEGWGFEFKRSDEFYNLNKGLVEIVKRFDKNRRIFDDFVNRYCLAHFSPHISIRGDILKNYQIYVGTPMEVREYWLMKGKGEGWKNVHKFPLLKVDDAD